MRTQSKMQNADLQLATLTCQSQGAKVNCPAQVKVTFIMSGENLMQRTKTKTTL
jgi:hypothetical protein